MNIKIGLLVLLLFLLPGFKGKDKGGLQISFIPVFNGEPLILNDRTYQTNQGDAITIEQFKCYISGLKLTTEQGKAVKLPEYLLLNAEDPLSLINTFNFIPADEYSVLEFNIGVDSTANVSGALEGALDPANGMYWAWNTGYINAKLTGYSENLNTLHHAFEYHIGGYMKPFNTLKTVKLKLNPLIISKDEPGKLNIYCDVSEWFKTPHSVSLSLINNVVLPDKNAMIISGNYADMFYVRK
jgi:hypothetical protein